MGNYVFELFANWRGHHERSATILAVWADQAHDIQCSTSPHTVPLFLLSILCIVLA